MADTSSPYGLRPVKRVDGLPWTSSIETRPMDPAGHTGNLYNGQVVAVGADGYITLVTTSGADASGNAFPAGTIGVFVGCEYENSEGRVVHSQYYPSGAINAKAKIISDPNVIFRGQVDGVIDQSDVGANTFFAAVQSVTAGTGGSTFTGNSLSALESTTVTTTAAFRVLGVVDEVGNAISDTYADILVKFNPGYHSYTNAVGI